MKRQLFIFLFAFGFFTYTVNATQFSHNLSQGTRDTEVKALQQYLNTHGYPVARTGAGSQGKETMVFGPATKQALIHFQKDNHITPANGYFGPTTRGFMATARSAAGTAQKPKTSPVNPPTTPNPVKPPVIPGVPKPITPETTPAPTYTIGGTIMGLTGQVTLNNNTIDQLILTPASASLFTFPKALPTGARYSVTAIPGSITEHCYLMNNSGTVASTNITTIQVACGITGTDTAPVNPFTTPIIPSSAPTTHELSYITDGHGIITGSSTQSITFSANGTEVTATPNTGYYFTSWNDGLTNPTRTDSNIRSTQSYTANFAINTYTLTYTAGANGTLSGTTTQTVTHGSAGTEVIALPDVNYHFVSWSDGVLTASRTDSNVISTKNLFATFDFTCGQTLTDVRDAATYPTTQIGGQCWLAKNLAYLPSVSSSTLGSTSTPYYYVHANQSSDVATAKATANFTTHGVLYNYQAALTACPTGWHLPADAEYSTLSTFLGGNAVSAGKLKSSSSWNGTNTVGFSSIPSGARMTNGTYWYLGANNYLWSSTFDVANIYNGWNWSLEGGNTVFHRYSDGWGFGMSVRCLKD